jgi:RNA polymerase sigma-70 factor (ECF subfamily)
MMRPGAFQEGNFMAQSAVALESLVGDIASGDQEAFRQLYDRVSPQLFTLCVRITRERDLARDILQEGFLRIWQKAHLYDPAKGNALAWMIVITRNVAFDAIRARATTRAQLQVPEADFDQIASAPRDPNISVDIHRCLSHLDEKHRNIIILAYIHGLSYNELADRFSAPIGTIKTWVHRGTLQLKGCLGL